MVVGEKEYIVIATILNKINDMCGDYTTMDNIVIYQDIE